MRCCILLLVTLFSFCALVRLEDVCGFPHLTVTTDNSKMCLNKIPRFSQELGSTVEYSCASLIKGFRAMINYCPVEVCTESNSWTKPSLSCGETECYERGNSQEFQGRRLCTISGKECQRWDSQFPHIHHFHNDQGFSDVSVSEAANYCRDPNGERGAPWCFINKEGEGNSWEFCNIPECDGLVQPIGPCGESTTTEDNVSPHGGEECYAGMKFRILKGEKPGETGRFSSVSTRSSLECATTCTVYLRCFSFSFASATSKCDLFEAADSGTVQHDGYVFGIKACSPNENK